MCYVLRCYVLTVIDKQNIETNLGTEFRNFELNLEHGPNAFGIVLK